MEIVTPFHVPPKEMTEVSRRQGTALSDYLQQLNISILDHLTQFSLLQLTNVGCNFQFLNYPLFQNSICIFFNLAVKAFLSTLLF